MSKRILIAPLDWGLGHATRCIPLISHLLEEGHQPIIASDGRPMKLLRSEFPSVETVVLEGYNISYPEGSGMAWKMFRSTPHILRRIREERKELDRLVDDLNLDAVISDNRFGLYSERIPSVYMTHQVMIKAPFLEKTLYRMHRDYMQKFTEVWVPDFEKNGLSGDLSHRFPLPSNGKYIGSLSRFNVHSVAAKLDVLVLISGPEPQRTRFEDLVLSELAHFDGTAMAVLGTPGSGIDRVDAKGHRIVSHLAVTELERAVNAAELVVSRSGYSTVMDLAATGKKAVFVPTPGQTEQEYLAAKFDSEKLHMRMTQKGFNLQEAWQKREEYSGFESRQGRDYKLALNELIATLS